MDPLKEPLTLNPQWNPLRTKVGALGVLFEALELFSGMQKQESWHQFAQVWLFRLRSILWRVSWVLTQVLYS